METGSICIVYIYVNKIHKDTGHYGFQQVKSADGSKSERCRVIKKKKKIKSNKNKTK